jgi:hypothetical protein
MTGNGEGAFALADAPTPPFILGFKRMVHATICPARGSCGYTALALPIDHIDDDALDGYLEVRGPCHQPVRVPLDVARKSPPVQVVRNTLGDAGGFERPAPSSQVRPSAWFAAARWLCRIPSHRLQPAVLHSAAAFRMAVKGRAGLILRGAQRRTLLNFAKESTRNGTTNPTR